MALARQHMECCVSVGVPVCGRDTDMQERVQQMFQSLEHIKYHKRLKKLVWFFLEKKEGPREELITVFNYLVGWYRQKTHKIFREVKPNRTRGKRCY